MTDYTIVNLGDVENVAPKFEMPEGMDVRFPLDDEVHELRQWDILGIGPGVMRSLEGGPGGITLVAFGAPISEENDGEIVPGWWTG
jgi:hypothetical protein